jgi:hypothetical protein
MIIQGQSAADYHASEYIGSTTAKLILKSPQLFRDKETGAYTVEDKPCFQIGRLIHEMVLEPDLFSSRVVSEGPINPATNKPYGRESAKFAAWVKDNPEKTYIEPFIHTALLRMPRDVKNIFTGGVAETSVYQDLPGGVKAKCRPDYLVGTHIYDLKTIDDIDNIRREIRSRAYWFSAAWYRLVMKEETGEDHDFTLVFMEKSAPWRYKIVDLAESYVEHGDNMVDDVLGIIAECRRTGNWFDAAPLRITEELPEFMADDFTVIEGEISL